MVSQARKTKLFRITRIRELWGREARRSGANASESLRSCARSSFKLQNGSTRISQRYGCDLRSSLVTIDGINELLGRCDEVRGPIFVQARSGRRYSASADVG